MVRSSYFILRSKLQKNYIFKIRLFEKWFYCPANNLKLGINGYIFSRRENYEIFLRKYFKLKSESYFWDIGANSGFYSAFQLSQKNIFIRALEPEKNNFLLLKKNINQYKKNKDDRIKIFNLGLGSKDEKLSINSSNNDPGSLFLLKKLTSSDNKVEVTTLDKLIKLTGDKKVDCLKIDVEGMEYQVLLGAKETLKNYKPQIIIELIQKYLMRQNDLVSDIFDLLSELGYQGNKILYNGKLHEKSGFNGDGNYFFINLNL